LLVGAGGIALREVALRHNLFSSSLGKIEVIGTVKSEPLAKNSFLITTESINGSAAHLPIRIATRVASRVIVGEKIRVTGSAVASSEVRTAGLIFANAITIIREPKPIFSITEKIRKRFRSAAAKINGDAGALIPGLVIGDTKLESAEFVGQMRRVGLTHLTAVSGENFAIIAAFLAWLLRRLIPKLKMRLLITGFVLILFIFLVRPSPSVARASVMTAISLVALARGIPVKAIASLGAALSLLILIDPFQALDPGFALSVGATAGIILLAPKLPLPQVIAIPIAATIMCLPVIIAISGLFSIVSIPANILAAPLVAPITILGFVAAMAPPLAPLLLTLISPFAKLLALIAHFGAGFPVLILPKSFLGAFLILAIILLFRFNYKVAGALLIPIFIIYTVIHNQFPGRNWEVVNCDVGQGDGLVINLGAQQAIVVDTGPDEKKMDSCLNTLGIRRIPLLVLTHYHADHVGGLAGVIRNRTIGQVWLTSYPAPVLERAATLKALSGDKKYFPTVGYEANFKSPKGVVKIKTLWPKTSFEPYQQLPGDGSSINNSSLVLLITINNFSILATGDIEPPVQEEIFNSGNLSTVKRIDILKVPHHGSAYQFQPFLESLHPKIALISVGAGNKYGHPGPKTIEILRGAGAKVMRTDLAGAIAVDPSLSIRTKRSDWWDISWG
jgi:competence protein ComEC